jgi:outer membrane protein assembly factor BamB
MDDQGWVYIGFTSDRLTGDEDFAVFRYAPINGEKAFLGTLMDVARSAGNLAPGESIPKGHTRLIFADGKVYMGTQGFHDFKSDIDDLPKYRGAHIFAFDTATNAWEDLAADFQDGVIVKNQGIVAMGILRDQHMLVGLTHPHADVVLFDYARNQLAKVIPGIPWKLGNPISREVIVAPSGRIYSYRGTEDPKQRDERHPVWVYDPHMGKMTNTGFDMTGGFWIGQTETRDRSKIYVSTTNGQLYEFDTLSETFKDLGHLLPKANIEAGRRIKFMYGVTLSPDEKKLYYAPALLDNPGGSGELYSYEIATGEIKFVQQLPPGVYTTADLRDDENIYMAHFGTSDDVWKGRVRLTIIKTDNLPKQKAH